VGENRNAYKITVGKPEGKRPLEELSKEGRIILKLKKLSFRNHEGICGSKRIASHIFNLQTS
jgi:hypothetical protein